MGWKITSEAGKQNVDQLTIVRRAVRRGLNLAHARRDSYYIDIFQHILDELERV